VELNARAELMPAESNVYSTVIT